MSRFEDQVREWATDIGGGYQGEVDDASLEELVVGSWRMNVAYQLAHIIEEENIDPESLDVEALTTLYRDTLTATVLARYTPVGSHTPVELSFEHHGPPRPGAGSVPPLPISLANYFLAFDAQREQLVYAYSHDYHQFGHAWAFDGTSWSQLSSAAYRLGSCEQVWMGGFDPERGGVAGWSFDDDVPVGVVIAPDGLTVLTQAGSEDDGDEPARRIELGGDVPRVKEDSEWDELKGIFGIDRARRVTVCMTEVGVWELGSDNQWVKRADVADGTLPTEAGGDRTFFGGGAGAVFDSKRDRLVFWINDGDDHDYWFFSWDGAVLSRLTNDGLPDELYSHFGQQAAVIGEDASGGVVLYGGDKGLYALGDDGWERLEAGEPPPGASKASSICSDPIRGLMMIGPGKYTASSYDEGGEQHAFYVRRQGGWNRQGKVSGKSVLGDVRGSGSWPVMAAAGGGVYAVGWRSTLRTAAWTDEVGWKEIVDEETGDAVFASGGGKGNRIAAFEGSGEKLHALAANGALFAFDGAGWTPVAKGPKGFGSRSDVQVAWDRGRDRIVVFGGEVKNRKSTDTFVFDVATSTWSQIAEGGTRPADYKFNYDQNGFDVDLELGYDSRLGRVVRYGFTEVAVLDDNNWRIVPLDRYEALAHPRARISAHDPATGETLIINMATRQIARFDVGGCDIVARWSAPDDQGDVESHNKFPFGDQLFDASGRRLLIHNHDDRWGTFCLDLAPAFELAASLSPRVTELPEPPRAPTCLYRAKGGKLSVWLAEQVGTELVVQSGALEDGPDKSRHPIDEAAALETAARAEGFGPIGSVPLEVVEKHVVVPRWSLEFPEDGEIGRSRFGGRPSGIDEWPDEEGEPLGFLFQLEVPEALGGGGVAVFCTTDGTATEDPSCNRVVRLSREQLAAAEVAPPEGVPELVASPIALGERGLELDESGVAFLCERDPEFAALIATLAERCGESSGFDKLGGRPSWVQSADQELTTFIGQVDFDGMTLESEGDGWEDAGLFGVLYIFVEPDSDETLAHWQYT